MRPEFISHCGACIALGFWAGYGSVDVHDYWVRVAIACAAALALNMVRTGLQR